MNAARDQILSDYGFGGRTMTRIDYDELCDRAEEAEISRRESVLGKLSDLSSRTDTPVKAAKRRRQSDEIQAYEGRAGNRHQF